MGRADSYYYRIDGIDKINIKNTHNGNENCITINSVSFDDEYVNVNITISNISYDYKNILISNSGYLTLKIGNMYSGHSKSCAYFGRGNDNPAHKLKKNETVTVYIPSNQINASYTTTISIPTYSVTGGCEIGDEDDVRVRDTAVAATWPYIIYKAMFCFTSNSHSDGVRDALNSDTMLVHCRYTRL